MKFLYNSFIFFYHLFIRLAAVFNPKAKLWVDGRKNIFAEIEKKVNGIPKIIWIHCASLGEFEQGRPLIEEIKKKFSDYKILLTFFSPSGYEIRKNYSGADFIFYLPMDSSANAKKFISIVKPSLALFVKYEFWFNYLNTLKKNKIPTYLVSGIFRENHYFFKWYSTWFRKQLSVFTFFFLQDETSEKLLNSVGYTNTKITGDTRFDRVLAISKNSKPIDLITLFKGNKKIILAGSTWEMDEQLISLINFSQANYKLIIAPHEVNENHIELIRQRFSKNNLLCFSQANIDNIKTVDLLIIDNIGMLSSLYQYADIAYIGGGFGKGIHNILEAAAFGMPIIFGPNYAKFKEANDLLKLGAAFSIESSEKFEKIFLSLTKNEVVRNEISQISIDYVVKNCGATASILNNIHL
ncbi:MAG TPA: glycosyltransferase N-terminal domain-containing protein [Bacteroidia bacterium]|nr:glycosyltransferase N-terminal domain-containing protein [Bacteroidia bacterium]